MPKSKPEYSVYVFHRNKTEGHTDWEMRKVTRNKYRALRWAEKYSKNGTYNKVEVKCKRYDTRYERPIDRTIKTLEKKKPCLITSMLKVPRILKGMLQAG